MGINIALWNCPGDGLVAKDGDSVEPHFTVDIDDPIYHMRPVIGKSERDQIFES